MKKKKIIGAITGLLLTIFVFMGVLAIAAEYGTQNDPLVSLSYINSVFAPELKNQIQESVNKQISSLSGDFDKKIAAYSSKVDSKIADFLSESVAFAADTSVLDAVSASVAQRVQNQGQGTSSFALVKLSEGQTLVCSVGTEILLRLGNAVCVSSGTPGLIDTTDAKDLAGNKALSKNHLYLCTVEGRGVATKTGATVLVRGAYSVK